MKTRSWLLAAVLALELAAFLPALTQHGVMRAPAAKLSEGTTATYPWRIFWRDEVAAGRAPLWNPFVFAGMPAAGEPQMQTFYPANIVWLWMNPEAAFKITLLLHVLLGTVLMYALVREAGGSDLGAAIGGLAFGLHSQMIVFMFAGWAQVVAPMAWAPGVLWMLLRAFEPGRPGRRAMALAGAMLGVQFLSGHPEWVRYTLLTGGLLILLYRGRAALRRRLAAGAAVLALGLLVGGPQLSPAIEAASRSSRGRDAMATGGNLHGAGLPPLTLPTAVVPRLFGPWNLDISIDGFVHKSRGAGISFGESLIYVGILPLMLAAFAMVRRLPGARPWAAVAVIGLLFALNDVTHLQCALDWLIPADAVFRSPGRFVFMTNLALAVLAGLGASRLETERISRRAVTIGVGAGAAFIAGAVLLTAMRGRIAAVILERVRVPAGADALAEWSVTQAAVQIAVAGVLTLLSLFALRWCLRARSAASSFAVLAVIALDLGLAGRPFLTSIVPVEPLLAADRALLAPLAAMPGSRFIEAEPGVLHAGPNVAVVARARAFAGADLFHLPEWEYADRAAATRQPAVLAALGITHVVSRSETGEPAISPVDGARGRAWWSNRDVSTLLVDAGLSPQARTGATIDVELDQPGRFRVRVTAPAGGWLVVTEVFYPGWRARVNGGDVEVQRAFGAMQAVRVPGGVSVVDLRYRPASVGWGLAGGALGLMMVVALLVAARRQEVAPIH